MPRQHCGYLISRFSCIDSETEFSWCYVRANLLPYIACIIEFDKKVQHLGVLCNTRKKMSSVVLCDCGSGVAKHQYYPGKVSLKLLWPRSFKKKKKKNCSGLHTETERARAFCGRTVIKLIPTHQRTHYRTAAITSDRMMATSRDMRCVAVETPATSLDSHGRYRATIPERNLRLLQLRNHSWEATAPTC